MALLERVPLSPASNWALLRASGNPGAGSGTNAPIGSVYADADTGALYAKVGSAPTNWSQLVVTSGFLPINNPTFTGLLDGPVARFTGTTGMPGGPPGVEIHYTSGTGWVQSYHRTGAAYTPLTFDGSELRFNVQGALVFDVNSSRISTTSIYRKASWFTLRGYAGPAGSGNGLGVYNEDPVSGSAAPLAALNILASDGYGDASLVPSTGIYSKGGIRTGGGLGVGVAAPAAGTISTSGVINTAVGYDVGGVRMLDGDGSYTYIRDRAGAVKGWLSVSEWYHNSTTHYFRNTSSGVQATISDIGLRSYTDLWTDQNYGHGLVGLYAASQIQGVFAMGSAYRLPANGNALTGGPGGSNFYGIAWAYDHTSGPNRTGFSMSHGILIGINGGMNSYLGAGLWTVGPIVAASEWFRAYSQRGLYIQDLGLHFYGASAGNWTLAAGGGAFLRLRFRANHESTYWGAIVADASGIGFADPSAEGTWGLRVAPGGNVYGYDFVLT